MTFKSRFNGGRLWFWLAFLGLLGGCSGAPVVSDQKVAQLKAQNMALLLGRNSGALSFLEIGTDFDISVVTLDGAEVDDHVLKKQSVDIPAGHHAMVLSCAYAVTAASNGGPPSRNDVEVDLLAGHVYRLDPAANGEGACRGMVVDISDNLKPQ